MCGIITDMMRVLTGLTAWLAGSALAVSLAWFGAGMVVRNTGMSPAMPVISPGLAAPPSPAAPASPSPAATSSPAPSGSHPAFLSASPSPSPPATAAAADGTVHGYTLAGGRVTLLVKPGSAELVTAVPAAGYSVQTWSGPQWLRVDFSSGAKVSSLIASWNGHAPSVTVTN
ncbi:MAG TPA: hypothetical protein VF482_02660 [Trebonia sp.]